jgi:methionyl-tRNA formyltransferase
MRMDVGLDTGPVFLERAVPIGPRETGGSLHDRLATIGGTAIVHVLDELAVNSAKSKPQSEDGITYAAKIDKAEALIDWRRDAPEIERKVRAFNPWPVAETRLDGEQLRIYGARVIDDNRPDANSGSSDRVGELFSADRAYLGAEPGTITDVSANSIVVACGRGSLALTELQRPGRKPVAARDLINTVDLAGRRFG